MTILGIVLSIGVGAAIGLLLSKLSNHRDEQAHKKDLAVFDAHAAFSKAAHEFAIAVLESHPELIRYDEELRALAERVAKTREYYHLAVADDPTDGYQSPLRELLV